MNLKTAIKLSIVSTTLLISACDSFKNDSLNTICENNAELCSDLHVIADCRFKRTSVIRARYYDKIEPNELHKLALITELDEYHACLELTLFMEFTRNKQRKEHRLNNYLKTKELMQNELDASKGTQNPILAYYLWTHYQDLQARKVFLDAATNKKVSDPSLIFKLALIKSKEFPQNTLNLFYKALRMTTSFEQIPPSTFVLIMTIYYQNKQFEEAYIWALIAEEVDEEDDYPINLSLILKKGNIGGNKLILNDDELQKKAEGYLAHLRDGTFNIKAPQLK